jgi:hypothetical protein
VFSAPGEVANVLKIARRYCWLGAHSVRLIVVLPRSPEGTAPISEALDRADIPAHFARGAVRI